jgi:hypothetical protein
MKKTIVSFIVVFALFVFSGCGGSGGDPPQTAAVSESPIENPTVNPEKPAETPINDPETPTEDPGTVSPTPTPSETPIIVNPVEPEPEVPTPPANQPAPAPLPDYVFRYTFSGIVDYGYPFEQDIGKPFYGVVHIDARNFYYDDEIGMYRIDGSFEDNYIEVFVGEMYVRAFPQYFFEITRTGFGFFTGGEAYDYETFQPPAYLSNQKDNIAFENLSLGMYFDEGSGGAEWTIITHGVDDPDADYFEFGDFAGGGDIDTITQIQ